MITRRVFVVGCPRSGTTLVQAILASSPRVFSLPETHFFSRLYEPGNRWARCRDAERALVRLSAENARLTRFRALPSISRRLTVRRFVTWMDRQAESAGCDTWVEKTPLHIRNIDQIRWHKGLEDAQFVHVLRNFQDTVSSLMRTGSEWGWPSTIREAIDAWMESLRISIRCLGERHHHMVSYDCLLENPDSEAKSLMAFLGLPFESGCLERLDQVSRQIVSAAEMTWKSRNLDDKGVTPNPHREPLAAADRAQLAEVTDLLAQVIGGGPK